jgi:hypothetical protein
VVEGQAGEDYSGKIADQDKTIRDLSGKIASLNERLDKADKHTQDTAAIDKKIDDVNATLAKVKEKVENQPANTSGSGAVNGGATTQDDFDKMADAREARLKEEERVKREKERADQTAKFNAAIVESMNTKLLLDVTQKEKIAKVLEAQNAKFDELRKKGQAARDNGEQFDWRKEMKTVSDETLAAVRAELTPGQATTFDELTKDQGIFAFAPQGGGMGGPGGPGGRRGGGNGGGGNGGGGNGG